MANFLPLKNYMFYHLDRLVRQYALAGPFLDVGCGVGDVSAHVTGRYGWTGAAIDTSAIAIAQATQTLAAYPVVVRRHSLAKEQATYGTVFAWDVIEHVEHDDEMLKQLVGCLRPGGSVVIVVPSNPREWRWDDPFYGHYRRYSEQDMQQLCASAGLRVVDCRDVTWPVFWAMRRLYTWLKRPAPEVVTEKQARTDVSATVNAWHIPILGHLLSQGALLWQLLYWVQYTFCRSAVSRGHEMMILAQRPY
jgi:SAM-dependent methyltransferase